MCDLNKAIADLACPAEMITEAKNKDSLFFKYIWKDFCYLADLFNEIDGVFVLTMTQSRPKSGHPSTQLKFLVSPERMPLMLTVYGQFAEKVYEQYPKVSPGLVLSGSMLIDIEDQTKKTLRPIFCIHLHRVTSTFTERHLMQMLADTLNQLKQVEHLDH